MTENDRIVSSCKVYWLKCSYACGNGLNDVVTKGRNIIFGAKIQKYVSCFACIVTIFLTLDVANVLVKQKINWVEKLYFEEKIQKPKNVSIFF